MFKGIYNVFKLERIGRGPILSQDEDWKADYEDFCTNEAAKGKQIPPTPKLTFPVKTTKHLRVQQIGWQSQT